MAAGSRRMHWPEAIRSDCWVCANAPSCSMACSISRVAPGAGTTVTVTIPLNDADSGEQELAPVNEVL